MILTQTPQLLVDARGGRPRSVVVQNLGAAAPNVIVGESYGQVKSGTGVSIGPGNATPQWTVRTELWAAVDPTAAVGTTQTITVIEQ